MARDTLTHPTPLPSTPETASALRVRITRRYPKAFRTEAVRAVLAEPAVPLAEMARRFDVPYNTLYKWATETPGWTAHCAARQHPRQHSASLKKRVIEWYEADPYRTSAQAGRVFGVCQSTVAHWVRHIGRPPGLRRNLQVRESLDEAVRLVENKLASAAKAARMFNVSRAAIFKRMRKADIQSPVAEKCKRIARLRDEHAAMHALLQELQRSGDVAWGDETDRRVTALLAELGPSHPRPRTGRASPPRRPLLALFPEVFHDAA